MPATRTSKDWPGHVNFVTLRALQNVTSLDQEKVPTGIAGLDEILCGGLPPRRLYLVQGAPGSGKTTLALQFLLTGARKGEKVLYISLSETREEVEEVARSHGWPLEDIEIVELSAIDHQLSAQAQNTLFHAAEVELTETTALLLDAVDRVKPTRVAFDSLSELRLLSQTPLRYRRQILAFKQYFTGRNCTTLLLDDSMADGIDAHVLSLAHGVIWLEQLSPDYGAERRRLNVRKVRGSTYSGGHHDFVIAKGGLKIFPRLVAAAHHRPFEQGTIASGIEGLDELLGGGLHRGTSTLFSGPPGTGKSTLALKFALAAASRGEKALLCTFDESLGILFARARGLNFNLDELIEQGLIVAVQIDPAELSPGELASRLQRAVREEEVKVVCLDSLNGYLHSMNEERFLNLQLHELLTYLNQQGIVTMIVVTPAGLLGSMQTPVDVTYLADTVITFRFFEADGSVHKAISVIKKRTGAHERTIRELTIAASGVEVGPPLRGFRGILTGTPTLPEESSGARHAAKMKHGADNSGGTVLIVAPLGKDAPLAIGVLAQAGIAAERFSGIAEVAGALNEQTNALLLAEESLETKQLPVLLAALKNQPAWSDIPIVILASIGGSERMSLQAVDIFGPAGNVTLLERPLHGVTLVSAMKVALRARRRQHEVRELIAERETVLTGISDAFSAIDREWRYTYVNDRVAELAGLPKEKLLGRNIWEAFPDAVGSEFYRLAHQVMQNRQPVQCELYHEAWKAWLDTRIYPSSDGIVVFRADISERKQQEFLARERELQLQESEDLLRLATEAAAIGTFDYYPQTGQLRFSERAKKLFGLPAEATPTYETYLEALHPEDRRIASETVKRLLEPGNRDRYDIEYRTIGITDGRERWVAEKGRVFLDPTGQAVRFIGTLIDVTEAKNAEIVLRRAKQEAEAANRAKDQFLAMLSHELRTPLTPVLMTIASLRRQANIPEEIQADLEVLQRNVELEALLIDDLLDLTRIAHGKLELHPDAVDVHTALEHALVISNVELQAKQLKVEKDFAATEHHCWADSARLQQVFWNLVKNAVKFTAAEGTIAVRTRNSDAHEIIVEVADTGVGIAPEILPRVFDAFEQGGRAITSQYGGLGLGLAISKRVIDMHGGSITAESAGRGHGATFTVTLQAMQTSLLQGPVALLPHENRAAQAASILFVEDHEDTARVLQRILEHAGYITAHADSLARARELAASMPFDLVISDVGLPDGSGVDLMRFLHARYGLSGIALSGFGTEEDILASASAGFTEHLTKPVDWPQLRGAIERLLEKKAQETNRDAAIS